MAQINNPRKKFQFTVLIPGLNPFLAQEVDTPDVDFDNVEHGDVGFLVKTAGMKKIGQLKISLIQQSDNTDDFIWAWALQIFDTQAGGGDLPSNYKANILVEQYANDGVTVIKRFQYEGCWPQKINGLAFSRMASDNVVQSVEFSVDEIID